MNNQPPEAGHQELMTNQQLETRHQELVTNQTPKEPDTKPEREQEPEKEQELEHKPSYKRSRPTPGTVLHQELPCTRSHSTPRKTDTKYQVDQVPGRPDTRKVGKQIPDTKRVENLNFRRRLEFTQEVPDTWVSPNKIFQVSLIPDIGRPEEQLGVPAEKANQKIGGSSGSFCLQSKYLRNSVR